MFNDVLDRFYHFLATFNSRDRVNFKMFFKQTSNQKK